MTNAGEIAERYLNALYGGDSRTARRCLDDSVSFRGPAATFSNADDYLLATQHAVRSVRHMEIHKVFVDGPDVGVFYELQLDHRVGSIVIADWYHFEGDRISTIRSILDTGPFMATTAETAVDPVCGMTVAKSSAAVTRVYATATFYFCNPGCANAFDTEPEHYVAPAA